VSRVSGFAPGPTLQRLLWGRVVATCGRLDRLWIWTPYLLYQKGTS